MAKFIRPYVEVEEVDGQKLLKKIEAAGRTCYKSEDKITDDSAKKFIKNIIKRGHESVLEHEKITARVICDRGVTHEIVRHRIASYSQESTRYCNYKGGVTFIIPPWVETEEIELQQNIEPYNPIFKDVQSFIWFRSCLQLERDYLDLLEKGWTPQQARDILPNSLKTEIVMTMNIREWRHFFRLRCATGAHPQMREVAYMLIEKMSKIVPVVFDDLYRVE